MRAAAAAALLIVAISACRPAAAKPDAAPKTEARDAAVATSTRTTIYRSHQTMGTMVTLTAYTADPDAAEAAFLDAFAEFDRLDALLTVWRPDSEVSQINAKAGVGPAKIGPETMDALQQAQRWSKLTGGKFDVTFGALSGLWKFDHDQDDRIPSPAEVKKRLPLVGWEMLVLDPEQSTAFLEKKGMKVHLGGIGKGFAVDKVVTLLKRRGLTDFMVQAGGDLYVSGRHGERAWRVGIRDPRGPADRYFAAAEVTDATFSTSGDYERFFIHEGRRYHHILDPDLGEPARGTRSVTIMAPDATTAEGLSKGVFILGAEKGIPLVEATEGAGCVVVDDQNHVHISKRLQGKVKILFPPTDAP